MLFRSKAGKLKFVGPAVSYTNLATKSAMPPPLLGEQTAAILLELGYDHAAVEALASQGIVKLAES